MQAILCLKYQSMVYFSTYYVIISLQCLVFVQIIHFQPDKYDPVRVVVVVLRVRGVIHIFGFQWKRPVKAQIFVPPLLPSPSPFATGLVHSI